MIAHSASFQVSETEDGGCEVTWITGMTMLLVILGFSLSGYLLPWDQKAYWATTVTISVAQNSPVIGEYLGNILRGGRE